MKQIDNDCSIIGDNRVVQWTDDFIMNNDLIMNIVDKIESNNIVPIIGPNVYYFDETQIASSSHLEGKKRPVQEHLVHKLLERLNRSFGEDDIHKYSDGLKGMSRLYKLFKSEGRDLSADLYSIYTKTDFLSTIKMDKDVMEFLEKGKFRLILTTTNYCVLPTKIKCGSQIYSVMSYKMNQVPDITIDQRKYLEGIIEIERPTIYNLFGTVTSVAGTGVVTENDFLQFLHCLLDSSRRPRNLMDYLTLSNGKYLLSLGCDIPDWTFRFLLHSLKAYNGKLRDDNAAINNFVGGAVDERMDEDIAEFLKDIGYSRGKNVRNFLDRVNNRLNIKKIAKVFISICSEDYDTYGDRLRDILSAKFDTWFFKYNGSPYQYWGDSEKGIEQGLATSDFILPVITAQTLVEIGDYEETDDHYNGPKGGIIQEWKRAMHHKLKWCPLYIGTNAKLLETCLNASKSKNLCKNLNGYFFSEGGNAGVVVDFNTFSANELYEHLKDSINS